MKFPMNHALLFCVLINKKNLLELTYKYKLKLLNSAPQTNGSIHLFNCTEVTQGIAMNS